MRIAIDNLDGLVALDYTLAVPVKAKDGTSLTVERGGTVIGWRVQMAQ